MKYWLDEVIPCYCFLSSSNHIELGDLLAGTRTPHLDKVIPLPKEGPSAGKYKEVLDGKYPTRSPPEWLTKRFTNERSMSPEWPISGMASLARSSKTLIGTCE